MIKFDLEALIWPIQAYSIQIGKIWSFFSIFELVVL